MHTLSSKPQNISAKPIEVSAFLSPNDLTISCYDSHKNSSFNSTPGEIRIPALTLIDDEIYAFFDVRPQPATAASGDVFNGKTLASDLPNPNQIYFCPINHPEIARPLREICPDMPKISSDAAVTFDQDSHELHIAFSSIPENSQIGYFDSRYAGERFTPGLLFGENLKNLHFRELSALYEILLAPDGNPLHPDALFATSGSSITWHGNALIPYVVRKNESTFIYVVHLRNGEIVAVSEAIFVTQDQLDETTLSIIDGKIFLNARAQGFAGRGAGVRYLSQSADGIHFSTPVAWHLPDPGCNAKQLGKFFIHPHSVNSRENGKILELTANELGNLSYLSRAEVGAGNFGYCDTVTINKSLYLLFERNAGLSLARFELK